MVRSLHAFKALTLLAAVASASLASAKTELLVFSSPFCGPCQQLKPTIAAMASEGYPMRHIDTTQHPALVSQFRIDRVPCLVLVRDGHELTRQLGGDRPSIERMFAAVGVRPGQPAAPTQQPAWANNQGASAPTLPNTREVAETAHSLPPTDAFAAKLLDTAVRITINDATGKSFGTGTIIDTRQGDALVVTCGHLFRGESAKGEITIERFRVTPAGLEVIDTAIGQLESYDLDRDVGLVSFRPNGPVTAAKVASQFVEQINDRVWSAGCDLGAKPTVRDSRITDIDRYNGPPNIEASGAPIQGRSGGGLFNSRGELVGICFAADQQGDEGLYSGLASVHAELDRLGLQAIYRPAAAPTQFASQSQPNRSMMSLPAVDRVVRGQDPAAGALPASAFPVQPAAVPGEAMNPAAPLPPIEQAGLQEIAKRASESEVVVIIRPRDASGPSELIRLDRVSPEFVESLRAFGQ